VPAVLVSENLDTTQHPKCNNTNARSMEHFRRLGIADALRQEAMPADVARASAYVTRFCGHEFGRLPRPFSDWPTPELPTTISQIALERTLRRLAERAPQAQIHFGWRLTSFAEDVDGVLAEVESQGGERRQIRARYLLGIDGASSTVRRALGFRMIGEDGTAHRAFMGGTMLSFFIRAPTLIAASGRTPTHMTWIINPELRGMMYSQDGRQLWVVHYQVPPGLDWQSVDGRATVRTMIGADVPFDILSGGPWTGGLALVAEHYQAGRVFLAGDAAHLFTPLGGLGMNTGISDVMNVGWKLAAVHEGWAGPRLIDTYETERRPIGVRNSGGAPRIRRAHHGGGQAAVSVSGHPARRALRGLADRVG
jgi:2-polyprenyl-6-methoxyphenol hydroxylase-like FAD-dependent oxidoreductase